MGRIKKAIFGYHQNQAIECFTLSNQGGYRVSVMTYGATLLEYVTPNRKGGFDNIIVGSSRLADYIHAAPRWGAAIGPVAGRIANGRFQMNGQQYQLPVERNGHHLHGGSTGFAETVFQVKRIEDDYVTLYAEREDGTGGYPGTLTVWITYQLHENGALEIDYRIQTNADTLVNPTNHSYFNLRGDWRETIDEMTIQVAATSYLELDEQAIPTGKRILESAALQALREGVSFADFFKIEEAPFQRVNGIDHPFELAQTEKTPIVLRDEQSGRQLTVQTEAPSAVIYTANGFDEDTLLEGDTPPIHCGVALETQSLPDAIHHDDFGSIILRKQEEYRSKTIYHATVMED